MRLEVNLTKKRFFFILGAVLILAGAIAAYAYTSTFDRTAAQAPIWGHSGDEVAVKISGTEYTLQQAIAQGLIGGGPTTVCSSLYDYNYAGWSSHPWSATECTNGVPTSECVGVIRGFSAEGGILASVLVKPGDKGFWGGTSGSFAVNPDGSHSYPDLTYSTEPFTGGGIAIYRPVGPNYNTYTKIYTSVAYFCPGSGGGSASGAGGIGSFYEFGGAYSKGSSGACNDPNAVTGSCSCPEGFTDSKLADAITGGEQYLNYCWKQSTGSVGGSGSGSGSGGVSSITGGSGISVSTVNGAATVGLKKDSTWSSYYWYYGHGISSGLTPGTTSNPACDLTGAGEYAACPASYFVVGMHYCDAQKKMAVLCAPPAPN